MREVLFRGKLKDNSEWVYGYLYITHNNECEIGSYSEEFNIERWTSVVIPETVGQYTGLTDKNGTKIFEGDIVKYGKTVHRVIFEQRNNTAYFGIVDNELETIHFGYYVDLRETEVIGNIYDNPELSEVQE